MKKFLLVLIFLLGPTAAWAQTGKCPDGQFVNVVNNGIVSQACSNIGFGPAVPSTPGQYNIVSLPPIGVDIHSGLGSTVVPQGTSGSGGNFYVNFTSVLRAFDPSWNVLYTHTGTTTECDASANHVAQGDIYNGKFYGICSSAVDGGGNSAVKKIGRWNISDGSFDGAADVSGTAPAGSFNGALTIAPDMGPNGIIFVAYFSTASTVYAFDLSSYAYLGALTLNAHTLAIQGLAYRNIGGSSPNQLLMIGAGDSDTTGVSGHLWSLDVSGYISGSATVPRTSLTVTAGKGEVEGIGWNGNELLLTFHRTGTGLATTSTVYSMDRPSTATTVPTLNVDRNGRLIVGLRPPSSLLDYPNGFGANGSVGIGPDFARLTCGPNNASSANDAVYAVDGSLCVQGLIGANTRTPEAMFHALSSFNTAMPPSLMLETAGGAGGSGNGKAWFAATDDGTRWAGVVGAGKLAFTAGINGSAPTSINAANTTWTLDKNGVLSPVNGGSIDPVDNIHPGYVAAKWYLPMGIGGAATAGSAEAADTVSCFPGFVRHPVTISKLGANVGTGDSGKAASFAVYSNGSWVLPSTPLGFTGDIDVTSTGSINGTLSANVSLLQGVTYWFCAKNNSGAVVMKALSAVTGLVGPSLMGSGGQTNIINTTTITGVTTSQPYATAWGNFTSGTSWSANISSGTQPLLGFLTASVP